MNTKQNKYFGVTTKSVKTESFNISLTNHSAESQISLHSHAKPYLCLLASGAYNEKSHSTDIITHGEVVYRTSNYEHSNTFSETGGVCLNIEMNDHEQFMALNELQLPRKELKQKGTIEIYKVLYALKEGLSNDVLNIYCYESVISVINEFKGVGDLKWVKRVKERIDDAPLATISLNQLSLEFSLHPNYIVRKFKEVTGIRLSEYLTKIRLEHSIKNLLVSDESLTSIALENGFYDQSHFNRNFKKYMEITPKHFRKMITG
jgi:AraC-like DNA-binding protein